MKKKFISIILCITCLIFVGCATSKPKEDVEKPTENIEIKMGVPFEINGEEYTFTAIRNDAILFNITSVIDTLEIDVRAKNLSDDEQELNEVRTAKLYNPDKQEVENGDFYLSTSDKVYELGTVLKGGEKCYTLGFENPKIDGDYQLIFEDFFTEQKYIFKFRVENLPQEQGGTTITYQSENGEEKYQAFPQ